MFEDIDEEEDEAVVDEVDVYSSTPGHYQSIFEDDDDVLNRRGRTRLYEEPGDSEDEDEEEEQGGRKRRGGGGGIEEVENDQRRGQHREEADEEEESGDALDVYERQARAGRKKREAQRDASHAEFGGGGRGNVVVEGGRIVSAEGEEDAEMEERYNQDGIPFTAFNLREENEEGYFDADGHYVHYQFNEMRDAWLESTENLNEQEMENARRAVQIQDEEAMRAEIESDQVSNVQLLQELITFLLPDETVIRALRRFRPVDKTRQKKTSRGKRSHSHQNDIDMSSNGESSSPVKPSESDIRAFERVTEIADILLEREMTDIYNMPTEAIRQRISNESSGMTLDMVAPSTSTVPYDISDKRPLPIGEVISQEDTSSSSLRWELRWSADPSAEVHGPVSHGDMLSWIVQGYFQPYDVYVRQVVEEDMFGDSTSEPLPFLPWKNVPAFAQRAPPS